LALGAALAVALSLAPVNRSGSTRSDIPISPAYFHFL
jgi:hypothetical protein